jgi:hypothetical protein
VVFWGKFDKGQKSSKDEKHREGASFLSRKSGMLPRCLFLDFPVLKKFDKGQKSSKVEKHGEGVSSVSRKNGVPPRCLFLDF